MKYIEKHFTLRIHRRDGTSKLLLGVTGYLPKIGSIKEIKLAKKATPIESWYPAVRLQPFSHCRVPSLTGNQLTKACVIAAPSMGCGPSPLGAHGSACA